MLADVDLVPRYPGRVRELDQRINAAEERLRALKPRIAEMEDQAKNGMAADEQEYHRLVAQYNGIVEQHNSDLNARKELYAQYDAQLQEVNGLVDRYNRLVAPKAGTP